MALIIKQLKLVKKQFSVLPTRFSSCREWRPVFCRLPMELHHSMLFFLRNFFGNLGGNFGEF